MDHEPVFWIAVALALAVAAAVGLALALLTSPGGEEEPKLQDGLTAR